MTATLSFLDLLQRLEAGDPDAAAILFDLYARRLLGFARRRLDERVRAKVDADDVVNSVFRTFFRRAAEQSFDLNGPNDLLALLVHITLRKCGRWNRHFRTRKRDVRREQRQPSSVSWDWDNEPLDTTGPRPEDEAVLREAMERLLSGFEGRTRRVCELRLQGYELEEIARELNCGEATVYRDLRRIKARMRQLWPDLLD